MTETPKCTHTHTHTHARTHAHTQSTVVRDWDNKGEYFWRFRAVFMKLSYQDRLALHNDPDAVESPYYIFAPFYSMQMVPTVAQPILLRHHFSKSWMYLSPMLKEYVNQPENRLHGITGYYDEQGAKALPPRCPGCNALTLQFSGDDLKKLGKLEPQVPPRLVGTLGYFMPPYGWMCNYCQQDANADNKSERQRNDKEMGHVALRMLREMATANDGNIFSVLNEDIFGLIEEQLENHDPVDWKQRQKAHAQSYFDERWITDSMDFYDIPPVYLLNGSTGKSVAFTTSSTTWQGVLGDIGDEFPEDVGRHGVSSLWRMARTGPPWHEKTSTRITNFDYLRRGIYRDEVLLVWPKAPDDLEWSHWAGAWVN